MIMSYQGHKEELSMNISARTALGTATVSRPHQELDVATDLAVSILNTLAQTHESQKKTVVSFTIDLDGVDPASLIALSARVLAMRG